MENVGTVIGLEDQRRKIILLLSLVAAEKIMTLRSALLRISCHAIRRKQRDPRNPGSLKPREAVDQKKDLKENENKAGQITLLDIYYIWMEKMRPTIPRARKANDSSCRGCSQNYQDECRIFQIPRTCKEAEYRGKSDAKCMGGN